jgi:hypothetical protein
MIAQVSGCARVKRGRFKLHREAPAEVLDEVVARILPLIDPAGR